MARCPECEGRKRVEVGLVMTKPCPRCHGTGEVEDALTCPECGSPCARWWDGCVDGEAQVYCTNRPTCRYRVPASQHVAASPARSHPDPTLTTPLPEQPSRWRCQGCGEWLDEAEIHDIQDNQGSHTVTGDDGSGNPEAQPCGPVDQLPERPSVDVEAWRERAWPIVRDLVAFVTTPVDGTAANERERRLKLIADAVDRLTAALPARGEGWYVPMSQAETYEDALAEGERRGVEKAIATLTGLTVYRSAAEFLQRNLDIIPRPEGDAPEKEGG